MRLTRRALAGALLAAPAVAQTAPWPADRPVRVLVPLAPGGTADFLARSLGQRLQEVTGLSFVVENRTGGGGAIAWAAASRAAADGTTLVVVDNSLPIAVALGRDIGFDARTELEPVTLIADFAPIFVVHPALPVQDIRGVVEYARARPGELFYGSGGQGSVPHLQAELFQDAAGIRMNHVSYRGMALAMTDIAGGRLQFGIPVVPTSIGQIRGGAVRAIGVGSAERTAALPELPTARESGIDFASSSWFGLMAPRGTPPAMAARMQAAIAAALAPAEVRARLEANGARVVGSEPEAFRRLLHEDAALWTRIVREKTITAD